MKIGLNNTELFATQLRIDVLKMIHNAHASHIGGAFSCADIVAVLYGSVMNYDPKNPKWENRDRFVLSKGHSGSVVYAALAEKGFFPKNVLNKYDTDGSPLSGHISHYNVPGVEFSTGSLGHGACIACGMALAAKKDNKTRRVFAIVGDGECDEGSIWEMALFAHQYKLNNFYLIIDNNGLQGIGTIKDTMDLLSLSSKFKSFGWNAIDIDGHNHEEIKRELSSNNTDLPKCIVAHTIKGKGVSFMENDNIWHYRDPQGTDYEKALKELEYHEKQIG